MRINEINVPSFDILVLHGRDLSFVENIEKIITSIGLTAAKVNDLPTLNVELDERVDAYIKATRLRIVIASFDETQTGTTSARPNVYDEITRSLISASKNTLIVLQETKDGKEVELPSNVNAKLLRARVLFERSNFAPTVPKLFREIVSRGLFRALQEETQSEREVAAILIPFMSKMDAIWERDLTKGWNRVYSSDANAVSKLTSHLDNFFIQYHKVFKALIRKKRRGQSLIAICNNAYEKCVGYAVLAWMVVADSKHDRAMKLHDADGNLEHSKIYEDALHQYRQIERARTEKTKIDQAKKAVIQFDQYIRMRQKRRRR